MKIWSILLVLVMAFASFNAEAARRMGGGGSFGKQSSNVTQRQNAQPSAPAQNSVNKQGAPMTPAATPAKRPWGAMLGGLAAGLGLAWLAHSLGMGAEFGQILMIGLLVLGAFVLYGMFRRSRESQNGGRASPYAYGSANAGAPASVTPRPYSPHNVGNDASARPWEGQTSQFQAAPAAGGSIIGSAIGAGATAAAGAGALSGLQTWGIPADFDTAGFLTAAKRNFVTLQAAWDRSDIDTLRAMMTDEMASEIKSQLADRASHVGAGPNKTDVVSLDAQLLGIEDLGTEYLASVEFNGVIQESPADGPSPFREVWNMSKAKDGKTGWLVAGVQALQ